MEMSVLTTETSAVKVHPNRLRFMYVYTIITAGILGLGFLVAPSTMLSALVMPPEEQYLAGIAYSVWFAFGILSALGLRSPVKFAPLLLLQLTYKLTWFAAIIIPHAVTGQLPTFAITMSALYVTIVIGDIAAIPWRYIFAK